MKRRQVGGLALLLLTVAVSGVVVLVLAGPWLPTALASPLPGVGAASAASAGPPGGFSALVASSCAVALVACWAWLALGTVVVAVQTSARTFPPSWRRLSWVPGAIRVLVPVLVGAAVTAAPASASTDTGPAPAGAATPGGSGGAVAGLPLPDRVVTRPTAHRTVLVRPGDSLWRITERLLPPPAPAAAVDRGWRRIARANARHVPDPDLIRPGTRLRVPPLTVHPREEAS